MDVPQDVCHVRHLFIWCTLNLNSPDPNPIPSRSRQRKPSEARAIFSYLAVEETGYPAADVARFLGVKRMSVHEAVTRGKALCDEYALPGQKYE